tara:strand:- start:54 stop:968 length:915 start_codon:yes stop_codon:yes gene_type:complete
MNDREKLDKLRCRTNQKDEDIVFYSYKISDHDHINEHEFKRLKHSISSLREFNNEISVYLFCDKPNLVPDNFKSEYSVNVRPFVKGFDHDILSAWSIHRWYNLKYFEGKNHNILYLDSDTLFYADVQYIFDTYCYYDVYGREEYGFRFDPNIGGGKNIKELLDRVDVAIYDLGGRFQVHKYCCGVILLNNNVHNYIISSLDELTELMNDFKRKQEFYPIPNPRIVDQYAIWTILSRLEIIGSLFGCQDVTMGYKEQKHQQHFNPVVLHYTTKGEQELAKSDEKYNDLIRDVDELNKDIDPYSVV